VRDVLPRFIEEWSTRPAGAHCTWPQHVAMWSGRPHVIMVRYEDLLADTAGTLARALPVHTGRAVDAENLEATVRKFSFERQSGRKAGDEAPGAVLRKGISGDWRNHFTRAAAEVFDRRCGSHLIELGYEKNSDWVKNVPD